MTTDSSPPHPVDVYISGYSPEVRVILLKIREVIRQAAPGAVEAIRYGIPTFLLQGNLVHYAAYARHIGFYPGPEGVEAFQQELAGYKTSRGTIQFPLNQPIPYDLIRRIVLFRVEKNRKEK